MDSDTDPDTRIAGTRITAEVRGIEQPGRPLDRIG